jgi:hypothetical protein
MTPRSVLATMWSSGMSQVRVSPEGVQKDTATKRPRQICHYAIGPHVIYINSQVMQKSRQGLAIPDRFMRQIPLSIYPCHDTDRFKFSRTGLPPESTTRHLEFPTPAKYMTAIFSERYWNCQSAIKMHHRSPHLHILESHSGQSTQDQIFPVW